VPAPCVAAFVLLPSLAVLPVPVLAAAVVVADAASYGAAVTPAFVAGSSVVDPAAACSAVVWGVEPAESAAAVVPGRLVEESAVLASGSARCCWPSETGVAFVEAVVVGQVADSREEAVRLDYFVENWHAALRSAAAASAGCEPFVLELGLEQLEPV